jgi:GNAT superfamily N-acetyltransferase
MMIVREIENNDLEFVKKEWTDNWGSERIVPKGNTFYYDSSPGFVLEIDNILLGHITYNINKFDCEIVSLSSKKENIGIGSALVQKVKEVAVDAGCNRLWLITTNDNIHALRFYQKKGFHIAAIYLNSIAERRKIKPEIPISGDYNIPIRDEIELEMQL